MKNKKSGARILAIVLLAAALCMGGTPSIGDKDIVRAMLVSQTQGEWTVGLICMQPGQAADSAEAEEQMAASWGSGAALSDAFMQAQENLTGKAIYKLCDVLAVGGEAPLQTLEKLCAYIESSGSGRLAARVLYSDADTKELQNPELDVSAFYAALAQAENDAPRLYQAAEGSLLTPYLTLKDGQSLAQEGAACLTEAEVLPLDEGETQAAWLLQGGVRTFSLTQENCALTVQSITGVSIKRSGETIVVRGLVRGLPTEQAARTVLLKKAQESLKAQLRETQSILSQAGMDAAHIKAHEKQVYGAAKKEPPAPTWDVRLWAE